MNLKKKIKGFFTLTRKSDGGFTLVELIVVIAILAILAGVAVPAYSGYVSQANKQADMTLASDVKNALMLGYYEGTLKPGASVVVYYDDAKDVKIVTDESGNDFGAAAAMTAAFGTGYTSLDLKWDGWKAKMGVAANAEMMGYVKNSNFGADNLDDTLQQVQTVVAAARGYFEDGGKGVVIDEGLQVYLDKVGVDYSNGVTADNAEEVANAMVFSVASNISNATMTQDAFAQAWTNYSATQSSTEFDALLDTFSAAAAKYAAVLSMARYIDSCNTTTPNYVTYESRMGGDGNTITDNMVALHSEMLEYMGTVASDEVFFGFLAQCENDAMAFLGYMDGVTSSADSLIANEGLSKSNYFGDGVVLDYVNDYMKLSDALIAANVGEDGAFVFYFNGSSVSCLPLDY